MNCAIYIRVSTQEQADEGFSISAQKQRLMAFAQSQDWDVVGLYPDEGRSAKDTERPELQRMLTDIRNGLIDVVLVYKLDRLTRSVLDLYKLLNIFEKHGCKFKSATEVYDTTTAIGRLFLTLVAALAQWERENLAERVRMGMREKVRQGNYISNRPPLGYDRVNGKLIINDVEAELVKKIFDMYLDGMGYNKIATLLAEKKIRTKRTNNFNWHQITISFMISNPIYIGKVRWGIRRNKEDYFTADDPSLRILSDEIFDRAQSVRKARSHFEGRAATSTYIFSGILQCAECGGSMSGKLTNQGLYENKYLNHSYKCENKKYHKCTMSTISERILEYNFVQYIKNMDIKNQIAAASDEIKKSDSGEQKKIKRLKKELEAINNRRKKWQYAWSNEMIEDEDFTTRMSEEKDKEESIIGQLDGLANHQDKVVTSKDAIEQLSGYIHQWDELDVPEKKQLLQILVKKIVVQHHHAKHYNDRVEIKEIVFN